MTKTFNIASIMLITCGIWFIAGYMAGYDDSHPITTKSLHETDD